MLLLNKCYSSRDDIFKKAVQAQVILGLATLYAFTSVKFNEFLHGFSLLPSLFTICHCWMTVEYYCCMYWCRNIAVWAQVLFHIFQGAYNRGINQSPCGDPEENTPPETNFPGEDRRRTGQKCHTYHGYIYQVSSILTLICLSGKFWKDICKKIPVQ